jgi:hypothetical protein
MDLQKNGEKVIDSGSHSIGQRVDLSDIDKEAAALLYGPKEGFSSTYDTMYFRGTPNSWETTPMELVADYTWEIEVTFGSGTGEFKFDVDTYWTTNFGDDNNDYTADYFGDNIPADSNSTYVIQFNDDTKVYTMVKEAGVSTTIRVHYDAGWGNAIYVRGDSAPLSWGSGQVATWTSGNIWVYETDQITGSYECKALINDTQWQSGGNASGSAGSVLDIYPSF